jgi:predicted P-loop ATPase
MTSRSFAFSPPQEPWKTELVRSSTGTFKSNLLNAAHALRTAPQWSGVIARDAFALQTMVIRAPPWEMYPNDWQQQPWGPHNDLQVTEWLQSEGINVSVPIAASAVELVGSESQYHPVLDYLDNLEWDGTPRLDTWMSKYLGILDDLYTQAVSRCSLIAAIARIRFPGCKVDNVPIVEGPQGAGKSTAVKALFDPWFTDEIADLGSKDAAMQTRGVWGIEIAELDAMSRGEVSKTKAFISRTTDRFRPPYGVRLIESPRSCVFWGSTNSGQYLKDETGGRRFWPVKTGKLDIEGLRQIRDQLWAEADRLHRQGVKWWLVNPNAQRLAETEQADRYQGDAWDEPVSEYLEYAKSVSMTELLRDAVFVPTERHGQAEWNRMARILKSMGWVRYQARNGNERTYRYRRSTDTEVGSHDT